MPDCNSSKCNLKIGKCENRQREWIKRFFIHPIFKKNYS